MVVSCGCIFNTQIRNLKSLWHVNKADFFIWLLTAVVSVFGDLDIGLLAGVVFSMVTVLVVSQLAKGRVLGKADTEDIIMDLNRKGINAIPGVRIIRYGASAIVLFCLEFFYFSFS